MILMTGASGFVASHLIPKLKASGYQIRALVLNEREAEKVRGLGVETAIGNVADAASMKGAFTGIDMAIHLVAILRESKFATFESVNVEASSYSLEIANILINRLKAISSIQLTERRDLEDFLGANDLKQNNNLENIIQIGFRLGLGYIISGSVDKRDGMIIANCQLINIGEKKVILSQVIRAFGYANMEKEVAKFADDVAQALSR